MDVRPENCAKCATFAAEMAAARKYKESGWRAQTSPQWDELLSACTNTTLACELRGHYYWYRGQLTYQQLATDFLEHQIHEHQ